MSDVVCRIVDKPLELRGKAFDEWLQPGWFVENPWAEFGWGDATHWSFKCPVCEHTASMNVPAVHTVVSRDPFTISPSMLCPYGCHYFIRDGRVC